MRSLRALALTILALAVPFAAEALELVAPARGVTLRGGTIASIEWKSGPLPRDAEEWEAFLSVDGGRYYGYRITPHLEIAMRRFSFLVPNVDTSNARIMIRTGDEERETRFEFAQAFSIARDPHREARVREIPESGRGESARDGDPAVLEWAEGSRDGSGLRERAANASPKRALVAATDDPDETATVPVNDHVTSSLRSLTKDRHRAVAVAPFKTATEGGAADVLLLCGRLNI